MLPVFVFFLKDGKVNCLVRRVGKERRQRHNSHVMTISPHVSTHGTQSCIASFLVVVVAAAAVHVYVV